MTQTGPELGDGGAGAIGLGDGAPGWGWVMWSLPGRGDGGVCWHQVEVCAGAHRCACRSGGLGDSQAVVRKGGPGMEAALKGVQVGPWVLGVLLGKTGEQRNRAGVAGHGTGEGRVLGESCSACFWKRDLGWKAYHPHPPTSSRPPGGSACDRRRGVSAGVIRGCGGDHTGSGWASRPVTGHLFCFVLIFGCAGSPWLHGLFL